MPPKSIPTPESSLLPRVDDLEQNVGDLMDLKDNVDELVLVVKELQALIIALHANNAKAPRKPAAAKLAGAKIGEDTPSQEGGEIAPKSKAPRKPARSDEEKALDAAIKKAEKAALTAKTTQDEAAAAAAAADASDNKTLATKAKKAAEKAAKAAQKAEELEEEVRVAREALSSSTQITAQISSDNQERVQLVTPPHTDSESEKEQAKAPPKGRKPKAKAPAVNPDTVAESSD